MAFEQIHLIILIIGIILTILPILLYRSLSKKENIKDSKPAKKELINKPIDKPKTIAPEAISDKNKKEEITSNSPTDTKKTEPTTCKEKYNSDIKKISLEGHNLRNIQERDYYLFYHKDTDSYYHNKEYLLTPVRDIIGGFFPFNLEEKARKKAIQENCSIQKIKDKWKHDGSLGKELGRHLHMQIENYFQNKKVEMKYSFNFYSQNINESNKEYNISKEFSIFKNLVEKEIKPNIYKTDWLIYSPEHKVIGSVDLIFKDADGSYTMCDWIRTNKLIDEAKNIIPSHDYGRGIYGMNNMVDNEYNKYCLKQNIHKYILEKYYNLKIETMYLVIVHPDYSRCYSIYIPDRQNEAEYMLQNKHLVIKEN